MAERTFTDRLLGRQPEQKKRVKPPEGLGGMRARVTVNPNKGLMQLRPSLVGASSRRNAEIDWREMTLDGNTMDRIDMPTMMEYLTDLSPEVSRALWDFILFCNPGWEFNVYDADVNEDDYQHEATLPEENEEGREALTEFFDRLTDLYGATDVVLAQFFLSIFLRGAMSSELVLDQRGRVPVDLVAIDPHWFEYQKRNDSVRGEVWQLGQMIGGKFVPVDAVTVRYVPVHPMIGQPPYGRPLMSGVVFSSMFLLTMMHDMRRVIAAQGYPRLDISVNLDRLMTAMPDGTENDPEAFKEWVESVMKEVADVYSGLAPEDAYIHTDVVTLNEPVGTVDAASLGAIDDIIRALERFIIRAVKSMPLLMASNEATTETHANRQWEVHAAGIRALQHLVEQNLEYLLGLALEAQGIAAKVKFRFAELRRSENLRDAQTENLNTLNAREQYLSGWISQDEAAKKVVGHKADQPGPRYIDIEGSADYLDEEAIDADNADPQMGDADAASTSDELADQADDDEEERMLLWEIRRLTESLERSLS